MGADCAEVLVTGRVLLVDDEPTILRAYARILRREGFEVHTASDGAAALDLLQNERFDALVTDVRMPRLTGTNLVQLMRDRALTTPVVIMTAVPSVESAVAAVNSQAAGYLTKPVSVDELVAAVRRAVTRPKTPVPVNGEANGARLAEEAIARSVLALQPIISIGERAIAGYEALLRPQGPGVTSPVELLRQAEEHDRLSFLGRHVRALAARSLEIMNPCTLLFVNLHPNDLLDPELYDRSMPLSQVAPRVVLELTERAAIEHIPELRERVELLRRMGYRIAVDDLGAGYSALSSLVSLEPEVVKLDMGLIRGIDAHDTKRRLVESLAVLARQLKIQVVGEGVETKGERDVLIDLGVPLLQGYYFARPGNLQPKIELD